MPKNTQNGNQTADIQAYNFGFGVKFEDGFAVKFKEGGVILSLKVYKLKHRHINRYYS